MIVLNILLNYLLKTKDSIPLSHKTSMKTNIKKMDLVLDHVYIIVPLCTKLAYHTLSS